MTIPPAERQAALDALAQEIRDHGGCGFEPCETATHAVPGEGPADARVMVVGEAPGAAEDREGRPFVGAAGRFLAELLGLAGLSREEVFVANVLKHRPPGNRNPRAREVAHELPWLEAQLELVDPELVVPMGRHALVVFAREARISDVHGTELSAAGRRLFPLFHPAAALHRQELRETLRDDAVALGRVLAG
jgi:uracil-DNA glycosylase family 4